MPIVRLSCRSCLEVVGVSAQHWLGGPDGCREPTMDPGLLQEAIDRQQLRDVRVKETVERLGGQPMFEVSEILGGVRDVFLRRHFPYVADAQGFNSTEVGTAIGAWSEMGLSKLGWVTQELVHGMVRLGTVEVKLFGWIDARTRDWSIIRDTKFGSQGSLFFQQGRGMLASEEHSAQVNLYDELARQSAAHGVERDTQFEVWYGANPPALEYRTNKMLDSWMRTRARKMTLAEIAGMRSAGSKITVEETARILLESEQRILDGDSPEEVAADIGPECETMYGSKKCSAYCSVVYTCFGLRGEDVRKAGRPQVRLAYNIGP